MGWDSDMSAFQGFNNIRTLLFSIFLHLLGLFTYFSGGWAGLHGFELAITVRKTLSYLVLWVELCPPKKICLSPIPGNCEFAYLEVGSLHGN